MNVVVRRLFNIYDADKDVHFVAAVTIALLLVCHIKFRCLLHICVCSQFVNVRIENWNQRRRQNSCQISSSIINPHPSSALPNRGKTITIRRLWMASEDASLEFFWFCVRWSASCYIFKTVKYEDQLSVVLRPHGKEKEHWTALTFMVLLKPTVPISCNEGCQLLPRSTSNDHIVPLLSQWNARYFTKS